MKMNQPKYKKKNFKKLKYLQFLITNGKKELEINLI